MSSRLSGGTPRFARQRISQTVADKGVRLTQATPPPPPPDLGLIFPRGISYLLAAVDRVLGIIDVEDDTAGNMVRAFAEQIDHG